ncbi:MAG: flippase-like domain-containing protein [Herpetosiphonaceae bacterium]|nr:flippase-like domain-containing protein [Herpetosiphonaceae bacterium]
MKKILNWALTLLGPAILVFFLLTNDIGAIWNVLKTTDPLLFALASVLVLPFLFSKGWRWRLILQGWDIQISTWFASILYTLGIFVGSVTPGQGGDAVKAWYLRRDGHPLGASLLSIVVDRFFDVAIMGIIAGSGLYFYRTFLPGNVRWLIVLALAGVVVGIVFLASGGLRRWLVQRVLPIIIPAKLRALARRAGLLDRVLTMSPLRIVALVLLSFVTLGWTFLRLYLLFLAAGVSIDVGPYMAMIAIVSLVSVISVGGVGTRDVVMVLIMTNLAASGQMRGTDGSAFSATQAEALALGISALFLVLNVVNIVLGFLVSLRYPLSAALLSKDTIDAEDEALVKA